MTLRYQYTNRNRPKENNMRGSDRLRYVDDHNMITNNNQNKLNNNNMVLADEYRGAKRNLKVLIDQDN